MSMCTPASKLFIENQWKLGVITAPMLGISSNIYVANIYVGILHAENDNKQRKSLEMQNLLYLIIVFAHS